MSPETFNEPSNRHSRPVSGTAADLSAGAGELVCVTSSRSAGAPASQAREH
ncbi:hypothetical protein H180DRAFT_03591 [Streptomyces sp. WMMB 322]|nr:hypothetical protein H180DRAFT_03591 [Streptomyces sp. WMMB 322]